MRSLGFCAFGVLSVALSCSCLDDSPIQPEDDVAAVATPPVFPVHPSPNARYLVDANANPFPIMGRAAWGLTALSVADYTTFLDDTAAKGFNAIELHMTHMAEENHAPFAGNGALPFLRRLDGQTWAGAVSYGGQANTLAPDFTTPNESYWQFMDALFAACEARGIMVLFFPAYVGYHTSPDEGWMLEMVQNGATRMQTYGAFAANRYKTRKNIVWMIGGDAGTNSNTFTSAESAVEQAFITGLKSVSGAQSTQYAAEWDSPSTGRDQVNFGDDVTLAGAYSWGTNGGQASIGRSAYSASSPIMPSFMLEEPYDEEGPDGNNRNPNATQPVRRFVWWGWLSTIGGHVEGNGFVWRFTSGWQSHLNTQGAQDSARLNAFITSIPWQQLVPSGLAGMKALVTAGGSNAGASDYVAAAANPTGTLLVAYVPPAHGGTITVDMTAMSTPARARWFNPTTAAYTLIASSISNTGTRVFTPPGNNGTGFTDWVLVLDGAAPNPPPTVATPASASPSTVTGATTNVSVLGADDGGEPSLTYGWSATGPGSVSFAPNGTNGAKSSTATFSRAGSYVVKATLTDAGGQSVTSSVNVTVVQTLTSIAASPTSATVAPGGGQPFSATANDQFGFALATQPSFAWSVTGGGTISQAGQFTAGSSPGGPFTVTASSGGKSGTASVTIANPGQSVVIGESSILPSDDFGNANLVVAQPATLAQAATIQSVSFYVTTAAGKLRLGLYDATGPNGGPGAKKAETAELTPAVGWNTATVVSQVALPAGTYWLAYLPSDNNLHFRRGGAATGKYFSFAYGVLPATFSSSPSSAVDHWSLYATLIGTTSSSSSPPTVATPASATANPVTGTTTGLSVLGADGGGEANLVYTWSTSGTPPAPVAFSVNGTNAAKNTTATFGKAGSYSLVVTIKDAGNLTVTSGVTVTVNQTLTSIVVSPSSAAVASPGTRQFTAVANDQFGNALAAQPTVTWTVNGGGSINASGLFTAGAAAGGPFTVTAASGGKTGTASVTVTVTGGGSPITIGETNVLSVDDNGNGSMMVAQSATLSQTATIQKLSFYVTTPAGNLRLGIYDATGPGGGPGAKKAETGEIPCVQGWNTANVLVPVSLPSGTYWLAYLPSANTLGFRKASTASNSKYYAFPYGTMPATFSTAPSTSGSHWSLSATLQP